MPRLPESHGNSYGGTAEEPQTRQSPNLHNVRKPTQNRARNKNRLVGRHSYSQKIHWTLGKAPKKEKKMSKTIRPVRTQS